jgi:hypothetical protein
MEDNTNTNPSTPIRPVDQTQNINEPKKSFFKAKPKIESHHKVISHHESHEEGSLHKKDVFLMSFFAFLAAGVVILLLLLIIGVSTGYITFDIDWPDFPGEKEETPEETPIIPAEENVTEEVGEEIVADVVEDVVTEEVVEEEEILPCDQDISLVLNDGYKYGLKVITLKLASDYSAQVSVGGKNEFMDVGDSAEINGLTITLIDSSEASESATIQVAC